MNPSILLIAPAYNHSVLHGLNIEKVDLQHLALELFATLLSISHQNHWLNKSFSKVDFQKVLALTWGIEKESIARREYEKLMKPSHSSFTVETTGLHICRNYPYLGASPDGLISCTCCGRGILEIKCPYSMRNSIPTSVPYLRTSESGKYSLAVTHNYYYQVQGQLGIVGQQFTVRDNLCSLAICDRP